MRLPKRPTVLLRLAQERLAQVSANVENGQLLSPEDITMLQSLSDQIIEIRNLSIYKDSLLGFKQKELGERYDLSPARISQILRS